jgi:hypothetical protein
VLFLPQIFKIKSSDNTPRINYSDAPGGFGKASATAAVATPTQAIDPHKDFTTQKSIPAKSRLLFLS